MRALNCQNAIFDVNKRRNKIVRMDGERPESSLTLAVSCEFLRNLEIDQSEKCDPRKNIFTIDISI